MGEVVILPVIRVERAAGEPPPAPSGGPTKGEVVHCSPPVPDTAPAEYVAPPDDCA